MRFLQFLWLSLVCTTCTGQKPSLSNYPKGSNLTYRTNVCSRFLDYATGTTNIRDALKGLNLTVGVVDQLNGVYIHFKADGSIDDDDPGIFIIILDELARRGHFNWRDNYARILPPEGVNPETGIAYNWTDVLYDSVVNYDFSFAEWVHNQERRIRGISFPVGWYDSSTILVQNQVKEEVIFDLFAFLRPFSNQVWGMIMGVFILSGLLYWLIDKIGSWGTENEVNSVLYDMFLAAMTFTQHHMYWDPSGHGKRIFAFSASFWSLVLASAYTANLASFLVSQGQPDFFATDLNEVESRELPLCVRANAAVEADLKLKFPRLNLRTGDDFDTIYKDLIDGECELLATRPYDFDQIKNRIDINPNCTLQRIGQPEISNKGGPATLVDTKTYCTSLITHVLEIHMNEMIDDGFIDGKWQAHLRNQSSHQCGDGENKSKDVEGQYSLTIKEVGGIFVFHAALGLVSILVALVERWWNQRQERDVLLSSGHYGTVDPKQEAVLEDKKVMPRSSMSAATMAAASHYQSSVALQGIINDRSGLKKSFERAPPPSDVDFNEDVMTTIQSLQLEMEKLQNYVVEKRNKQNGEGAQGA